MLTIDPKTIDRNDYWPVYDVEYVPITGKRNCWANVHILPKINTQPIERDIMQPYFPRTGERSLPTYFTNHYVTKER